MKNNQKKLVIQELVLYKTLAVESYYRLLEDIGDNNSDYGSYMKTAPINCEEELRRLPNADYGLCCALLTMLLREDHFCNGSFEERYKEGQVQPILDRMIKLLD